MHSIMGQATIERNTARDEVHHSPSGTYRPRCMEAQAGRQTKGTQRVEDHHQENRRCGHATAAVDDECGNTRNVKRYVGPSFSSSSSFSSFSPPARVRDELGPSPQQLPPAPASSAPLSLGPSARHKLPTSMSSSAEAVPTPSAEVLSHFFLSRGKVRKPP